MVQVTTYFPDEASAKSFDEQLAKIEGITHYATKFVRMSTDVTGWNNLVVAIGSVPVIVAAMKYLSPILVEYIKGKNSRRIVIEHDDDNFKIEARTPEEITFAFEKLQQYQEEKHKAKKNKTRKPK